MSSRFIVFTFFSAAVALLSAGLSGGLAPQSRAAADDSLAIAVNRTNPVENLSFQELRKIFSGEQTHWSNGRRVTVVMLEPGNSERQAVLCPITASDQQTQQTTVALRVMHCVSSRAESGLAIRVVWRRAAPRPGGEFAGVSKALAGAHALPLCGQLVPLSKASNCDEIPSAPEPGD